MKVVTPHQLTVTALAAWWASRGRRLIRIVGGTAGVTTLVAYFLGAGFCKTPWEAVGLLGQIVATVFKTVAAYVARGCRPLFPQWTLQFEVLRAIMRHCSSRKGHRIADEPHARVIRWQTAFLGSIFGWFSCQSHGSTLSSVHVHGLEHLWLHGPVQGSATRRLVILYFHGGGYAVLSPRMYISFCNTLAGAVRAKLGADTQVDVFVANYRKIPEHKFPVPAEDAQRMYDYLLDHEQLQPSQIIIAGDSAGGGLVMSTLLRVRDRDASQLPLAAITSCPFVDLTGDEDENRTPHCVLSDNITQASRNALVESIDDPSTWSHASAVHCDLGGLPPMFVQAASLDYLFEHSKRLVAKATADGASNWELDVHEGVPHVFTNFPTFVLPYSAVGIERMAAFAARQFEEAAVKKESETTEAATGA